MLTIAQGLIDALSTLLTLAEVTNLRFCKYSATDNLSLVLRTDLDLSRYGCPLKCAPSLDGAPHLLNLVLLFLAPPMGERAKPSWE